MAAVWPMVCRRDTVTAWVRRTRVDLVGGERPRARRAHARSRSAKAAPGQIPRQRPSLPFAWRSRISPSRASGPAAHSGACCEPSRYRAASALLQTPSTCARASTPSRRLSALILWRPRCRSRSEVEAESKPARKVHVCFSLSSSHPENTAPGWLRALIPLRHPARARVARQCVARPCPHTRVALATRPHIRHERIQRRCLEAATRCRRCG